MHSAKSNRSLQIQLETTPGCRAWNLSERRPPRLERDSAVGRKPPSFAAPIDRADMDTPHVYKIRVEGHLANQWSDWFDGLTIRNKADGDTILIGPLMIKFAHRE